MNEMHTLGSRYNTDKVTHHKYHEIFPVYIEKFYKQSGGMLEIGLQHGPSLQMWLELFPEMHIYGLDISPQQADGARHTIIKTDQSSENDLENALGKIKHPLYFINDDGSHIPEHQLLTFNKFFPLLGVGGVYIIEDIETSYWTKGTCYTYETRYGKGHPKSIIEIFKQAIDGVNFEFSQSSEGQVQHQKEIESICFHKNCIVITKRKEESREYRYKGSL